MVPSNFAQYLEDLRRKFSSWRYDERPQSIQFRPFLPVEVLQYWQQKGQSLPTSSLCSTQDISSLQRKWYGLRLDVGKGLEVRCLESGGRQLGQREVGKVFYFSFWILELSVLRWWGKGKAYKLFNGFLQRLVVVNISFPFE